MFKRSEKQPKLVLEFEEKLKGFGRGVKFSPLEVEDMVGERGYLLLNVSVSGDSDVKGGDIADFVYETYGEYQYLPGFMAVDKTVRGYDFGSNSWHTEYYPDLLVDAGSLRLRIRHKQGRIKVNGNNFYDVLLEHGDTADGLLVLGERGSRYIPGLASLGIIEETAGGKILKAFYSNNRKRGLFLHLSKALSQGISSQDALREFFGDNYILFPLP